MKMRWQPVDWIMEGLAAVLLLLLIGIPIYFWNDLPAEIPSHFNAQGEPDAFGSKYSILGIPVIGTIILVAMTLLNRIPHLLNYPVPITRKNARKHYRLALRMLRVVKIIVGALLALIVYSTVRVGLGEAQIMSIWIIFGMTGLIIAVVIGYMYRASAVGV